ncbi:hypothetical protein C0Q70_08825 [Pomacea canaliculata]|uniref:Uncharacterized protein n=1 Tax=Pomacea canaliculata TaxID=400727 RepID=A0A2T7P833_POMCA|nr:hypothetical protein C0Q70_08825 [Pomacea canaliculata]
MWVDETGTNSSKTQSSSLEGWEFRYDAPQRHCGLREVMLGAGGLENHTSDYYRHHAWTELKYRPDSLLPK